LKVQIVEESCYPLLYPAEFHDVEPSTPAFEADIPDDALAWVKQVFEDFHSVQVYLEGLQADHEAGAAIDNLQQAINEIDEEVA